MFINIKGSSPAALEDAENFQAFKIVCSPDKDACTEGLTSIGTPDGDHVWVNRDWLVQNGPQDEPWRAQLAKMITFADGAGWVNEAGQIRAHIETA